MDNKLVYFVDDDPLANQLFERVAKKIGFNCEVFNNASDCLLRLNDSQPNIVLTDLNMPGIDGFELIQKVTTQWPNLPIIAITGQSSIDRAVQAMRAGACDFIKKPYQVAELKNSIDRNIQFSQLASTDSGTTINNYQMVGESAEILRVYKMINKLGMVDCPVIIAGESGTGKELAAQAIHKSGKRNQAPFVAIDCGSLPDNLLESELFGHVKGAFTGATSHRQGLFEYASEGTIFLDEIGNISPIMQNKLLRVCQENIIIPVGSNQKISIKARLICASNRNLDEMVAAGEFRHDLYHCLNVITLPIPSVKDRREDIPLLIEHFIKEFSKKYDQPIKRFSNEWSDKLSKLPWNGNIRELKNYIERCIILSESDNLDGVAPPDENSITDNAQDNFRSLKTLEQEHIQHVLKGVNGNQNKASKILGIGRSTLWRKLNDKT